MLRRQVLIGLSAAAAATFAAIPMRARATSHRDALVFVFLRGGADGLNMVIPHGDDGYYTGSERETYGVSIAKTDVIDLDGYFGLNPALSGLSNIYNQNNLAIVHAAGVTGGNHSHFAMQDFIEFCTHASGDGWIKRYFEKVDSLAANAPFRGAALSGRTQKSLAGDFSALTADFLEDFALEVPDGIQYKNTLGGLLDDGHDFAQQGRHLLSVVDDFQAREAWTKAPENGASYPQNNTGAEGAFVRRMAAAAQVLKAYPELEVLCLDFDGWDTHADQLNRMQGKLQVLGDSLAAFNTDMGSRMGRTTVVVLSEFGRRIMANSTKGTDHGLGGCMLVMGQGVVGGQVYARNWQRENHQLLSSDGMNQSGNLKVTTDYRGVLAELLSSRMGMTNDNQREHIFPDFAKNYAEYFQPLGLFHHA